MIVDSFLGKAARRGHIPTLKKERLYTNRACASLHLAIASYSMCILRLFLDKAPRICYTASDSCFLVGRRVCVD